MKPKGGNGGTSLSAPNPDPSEGGLNPDPSEGSAKTPREDTTTPPSTPSPSQTPVDPPRGLDQGTEELFGSLQDLQTQPVAKLSLPEIENVFPAGNSNLPGAVEAAPAGSPGLAETAQSVSGDPGVGIEAARGAEGAVSGGSSIGEAGLGGRTDLQLPERVS